MVPKKYIPYITTYIHSKITLPKDWINDIKHTEFNELLVSSTVALAYVFQWKKKDKQEFIEMASGMLSSSFVYGEPVGTISSIAALGYSYTKIKNK